MKEPIAPEEVRPGDLVRWESSTIEGSATEYRATGPVAAHPSRPGRLYLLDRPSPLVELPTSPTLGWVEATDFNGDPSSELGFWKHHVGVGIVSTRGNSWPVSMVTGFVPAVAVPKAALDRLRSINRTVLGLDPSKFGTLPPLHTPPMSQDQRAIKKFLNAVDAANKEAAR